MFTDLVTSTALLERLGDDAAERVRRTHFGLLRDAVAGSGGHEVKNLGDGLMVVFPSAVDALGCAVAMQQAVHRHNARDAAHPLAVRIGLQVGDPIRSEDDYFGTAVVIAKRLCDRAAGGQIVASELVCRLAGTRGGYRFDDLGELRLKGLAEPLRACAVGWEPAPAFALPPRLTAAERSPFVGRTADHARLEQAWQRARQGKRQLVLLAGEPGIGKTRLAVEFARKAHAAGAMVLYGRSSEETLIPYQPFVEALEHYVTNCPDHVLRIRVSASGAELVRLLPALAARLPALAAPAPGDPDSQRYRLFSAVAALLAGLATHTPLVLILDDLHWADRPTLLLLQYLVRAPEAAPLLVLGTYRDLEVDAAHPMTALLADLRRDHLFERLGLGGLEEREVAALLAAVAGQEASPDFVRAVHAQTEGNPFFIGELLLHLVETGKIYQRDGKWIRDVAAEDLAIPEGVREVIGRRLARLGETCHRVLALAAVIGREFALETLDAVSDLGSDRLLECLEEAVAALVIAEVPRTVGRYSFHHALIRETLYRELAAVRRVRLHRRIAEALEQLHGAAPGPYLGELAYHFAEAARDGGLVEKAIRYAREAGARAMAQCGYEEAAAHYERALGLIERGPTVDEVLQCELLLALGESRAAAGSSGRAQEAFREAGDLARRRRDAERLARATLGYAGLGFTMHAVDPAEVVRLEEALQALPAGDSILRAALLSRLAGELRYSPRREEVDRLSREGVEMARRLGDTTTLARALALRCFAIRGPDTLDERLSSSREAMALAEASGNHEAAFAARGTLLGALIETGDIAAVDEGIAAQVRHAAELRQPLHLWGAKMWQATSTLLQGRHDDAEALATEGVAVAGQAAGETPRTIWAVQIGVLRWQQGRLPELVAAFEAAIQQYPHVVSWRCALVVAYCEACDLEKARAEFERLAAHEFADLSRDTYWLGEMYYLAYACAELGDERRARMLYDMLLPYAHRLGTAGSAAFCLGSEARAVALLAATMRSWDVAAQHFEEALSTNARVGAVPWLAFTQHDYARMLLARRVPGDRERAIKLLSQACETAARLAMAGLLRRTRALLPKEEATHPGPAESLEGPSPSEGPPTSGTEGSTFRREGEYWTLAYGGTVVRLRDVKGLRYIAMLLRHAGEEVHTRDLASEGVGAVPEVAGTPGGVGPLLDPQARAEYKRRLVVLREELAEAERCTDAARTARAQEEIEFLAHELSAAVGLGGRDREPGSVTERARLMVTQRIRAALQKVDDCHPALGRHLRRGIRTGTFCAYTPEPDQPTTVWAL